MKKNKTPIRANSNNINSNSSNIININKINAPNEINEFQMKNSSMNNSTFIPNLDFNSDETGESIRVCIRVRPMNTMELGRGDSKCVEFLDNNSLLFKNK